MNNSSCKTHLCRNRDSRQWWGWTCCSRCACWLLKGQGCSLFWSGTATGLTLAFAAAAASWWRWWEGGHPLLNPSLSLTLSWGVGNIFLLCCVTVINSLKFTHIILNIVHNPGTRFTQVVSLEKGAITDNCPIATLFIIASYLALFNILCIEKHLRS